MKQFNLAEYLANPSRKIVTRDGRNVKIHCTNYYLGNQCIIAEVEGIDSSYSYNNRGLLYGTMNDSPLDLFFAPEKEEDSLDKPKAERFDVNTFQPFEKVLFRLGESPWRCGFFSHIVSDVFNKELVCTSYGLSVRCVPYNDETKHLIGTTDDCPEYYKWWED